jgi:uncharacterized protein DUF2628
MLTFTVHEPPNPPADRADRAERLAFVRDGFSWTAAVLAPVWLLAHRLWWAFAGYLVAEGAIEVIRQSGLLHPGWTTLAAMAMSLLIGLEASTLRRWSLDRRGLRAALLRHVAADAARPGPGERLTLPTAALATLSGRAAASGWPAARGPAGGAPPG